MYLNLISRTTLKNCSSFLGRNQLRITGRSSLHNGTHQQLSRYLFLILLTFIINLPEFLNRLTSDLFNPFFTGGKPCSV